MNTIRDNDIYEREESVRRILTKQINTLKDCKYRSLMLAPFLLLSSFKCVELKLEMQNRQMADREI